MSDTVNIDEVLSQDFPYAEEKDLPAKGKFSTTRKAGYVEDEVDVWMDKTIENVTEFLNRYNSAAYALSLLKVKYSELDATNKALEANIQTQVDEAVRQYHTDAEAQFNAHYVSLQEASAQTEASLRAELEQAQARVAEAEAHIAELEANPPATDSVQEEVPVVEPTPVPVVAVNPVTDASVASQRSREIMEAAAQEAADHVQRALQKVAYVEGQAQAEADAILSEAEAEAERIKLQAFEDANEAIEIKNKAVAERNEIFERLRMFYLAQEQSIEEEMKALDYTPYLNLQDSPASVPTVEESPVVETFTVEKDELGLAPEDAPVAGTSYHAVDSSSFADDLDALQKADIEPETASDVLPNSTSDAPSSI